MSDPSKAIRAEREYRKRLTEQHLGIRHHFDDHKNDLAEVFATWIEPQTLHLDRLYSFIHSRRTVTRFLEVGAEKGHLGIHLVNRHGLKGVSIDLSLDALRLAAPVVQARMQAKTRPPAASADVHALPFRDRTFDMVFCFSSLHHFYDPDLALEEIRRVLASKGVFFCSWEPMCPVFRPKQVGGSEVEWGVLENRYTYFQYRRMLLRHFAEVETFPLEPLSSPPRGNAPSWRRSLRLLLPDWIRTALQVFFLGSGNYTAICWMS